MFSINRKIGSFGSGKIIAELANGDPGAFCKAASWQTTLLGRDLAEKDIMVGVLNLQNSETESSSSSSMQSKLNGLLKPLNHSFIIPTSNDPACVPTHFRPQSIIN